VFKQPQSGRWRILCQEPCDLQADETSYAGTLWNVSVAGAYVATTEPVGDPGRRVILSFCLPGELTLIRVNARVAWVNPPASDRRARSRRAEDLPPGCGLEFLDLAQIERTRITARVQGI